MAVEGGRRFLRARCLWLLNDGERLCGWLWDGGLYPAVRRHLPLREGVAVGGLSASGGHLVVARNELAAYVTSLADSLDAALWRADRRVAYVLEPLLL